MCDEDFESAYDIYKTGELESGVLVGLVSIKGAVEYILNHHVDQDDRFAKIMVRHIVADIDSAVRYMDTYMDLYVREETAAK